MSLSWFEKYEGEVETLYFKKGNKPPWYTGLGVKVDIFGNQWHCAAIYNNILCCRKHHGFSTNTSSIYQGYYGSIHRWVPYKWEFVDSPEEALERMKEKNDQ